MVPNATLRKLRRPWGLSWEIPISRNIPSPFITWDRPSGIGLSDLYLAAAKQPNEAQPIRDRATNRFNEAARYFSLAMTSFTAKLPKADMLPKDLPAEADWAARARADLAEMELRVNKFKEARTTSEPFIKDMLLQKSKYRLLGLYYHGYASFLLQDYLVAGRSLNQLAPFSDPIYGIHARYLMGRIYQASGEFAEAGTMYEACADRL